MPTFNSAAYVAESIESIQRQTYTRWELLIADDCSRDNTRDIIQRYADSDTRIRLITLDTNSGAAVARNAAIDQAQGRFIAFCDSDDQWLPTKLEQQVSHMLSNNCPLCFAPYYTIDERGNYLAYIAAPQRVTLRQLRRDNKIGFLTCIYDTQALGKHHMPLQRKRQDWALLLTLLQHCHHAESIQQPLAKYRLRRDSLSASKLSLIRYNAQTYTNIFHWSTPRSYTYLFVVFLPCHLWKRLTNAITNALRALGG